MSTMLKNFFPVKIRFQSGLFKKRKEAISVPMSLCMGLLQRGQRSETAINPPQIESSTPQF